MRLWGPGRELGADNAEPPSLRLTPLEDRRTPSASFEAPPAFPAPGICIAEYADPRPPALQQKGLVDAVVILPLRRGDIGSLLGQLAAGETLALELAGRTASTATACWWPTTAK